MDLSGPNLISHFSLKREICNSVCRPKLCSLYDLYLGTGPQMNSEIYYGHFNTESEILTVRLLVDYFMAFSLTCLYE